MIKSKLIFSFLIIFQSTFFVGCNRPTGTSGAVVSIEKATKPKTIKIADVVISEKKPEKSEISTNVTLAGTIFFPADSYIPKKILVSVLPVNNLQKGIVNKYIQLDSSGYYSLSNLVQGIFDIEFKLENFKTFKTNLFIFPQKTELNFSFCKIPIFEFQGKVINGFDNEPVENVNVCALDRRSNEVYNSSVTDSEGIFSIPLKEDQFSFFNTVVIDEPGFAKVSQRIRKKNLFVTIILQQAGHFTGTVTKKDGTPIPKIIVSATTATQFSDPKCNYYKSLPTDYYGVYFISNVVAPAKYRFRISNPDFVLNSITNYCSAEPIETVEYNLTVMTSTVLAFKAFDERKHPLLNYKLKYFIFFEEAEDMCLPPLYSINLDEDEWYCVNLGIYGGGSLHLFHAYNDELGIFSKTNSITFTGQITNYINLHLENPEKNITGYLFKPDGSPAKGFPISGKANKTRSHDYVDEFGYFEFSGIKAKKNEMIEVNGGWVGHGLTLITNLPSGSKNVELTLKNPCQIKGKVFLENINTPATNFSVSHSILKNQQSYHSKDGSFIFNITKLTIHRIEPASVIIFTKGFLPVAKKYNLKEKDVCNLGNIILKSGETGNIKGRIVNQNRNPLPMSGVSVNLSYKDNNYKKEERSKSEAGNYLFKNVLPGKAELFAEYGDELEAWVNVEIIAGETIDAPDLIIGTKDKVALKLKLKLPDGSRPLSAKVNGNGKTFWSWGAGTVHCVLKIDTHRNWIVENKGKKYIADDFEVTKFTDEIEVRLREE